MTITRRGLFQTLAAALAASRLPAAAVAAPVLPRPEMQPVVPPPSPGVRVEFKTDGDWMELKGVTQLSMERDIIEVTSPLDHYRHFQPLFSGHLRLEFLYDTFDQAHAELARIFYEGQRTALRITTDVFSGSLDGSIHQWDWEAGPVEPMPECVRAVLLFRASEFAFS